MNKRIRKKHTKRRVREALERQGMSMKDLQDDTCEVARWVKGHLGRQPGARLTVRLEFGHSAVSSCTVPL